MEVTKKRRSNAADRIVLTIETQDQLKRLASQIESETNGVVSVPLRELANFIIQIRSSPFTESEMKSVRSQYFDEMKALKRAIEEVKNARSRGDKVDISEVIKKLQMQSVDKKGVLNRAPRTKKNKDEAPVDTSAEGSQGELPTEPKGLPAN